ncbi:MAG: MBL fold metallo-hydrolase RNA specificity domain-containing protein, partial [Promethearchaeota archaeon]
FSGILSYKPLFQVKKNGIRIRNPNPISRELIPLISGDTHVCADGAFKYIFYETDHSIPGAGAYLIEDLGTGKRIVYTGDIRMHGPKGIRTRNFIKIAGEFKPDALIVEGTRLGDDTNNGGNSIRKENLENEEEVKNAIQDLLINISKKDVDKLVIFQCSGRDLWRFSSFYKAAMTSDRTLIINAKTYHLLKILAEQKITFDIDLERIKVYLPRKSWGLYVPRDYSNSKGIKEVFRLSAEGIKIKEKQKGRKLKKYEIIKLEQPFGIRADEINKNPGKYIIHLHSLNINELLDIQPPEGSYFILSRSEPFDDEGEIEARKRKNWLRLFKIPDDHIHHFHCSGHLPPEQLRELVEGINPKKIFPVHTEHPELFKKMFGDKFEVVSIKYGEKYFL